MTLLLKWNFNHLPDNKKEIFKYNRVLNEHDTSTLSTYDYVVVAQKFTINFTTLIKPYLSKKSKIVLIQNGIHIEEPYINAFPEHELISGLAFICVSRTAPGQIHHQDYGKLTLGSYPNGYSQSCQDLVTLFNKGNADCHLSSDIAKERFIKLWNAPFNPYLLPRGVTTQDLLSSPVIEARIRTICMKY